MKNKYLRKLSYFLTFIILFTQIVAPIEVTAAGFGLEGAFSQTMWDAALMSDGSIITVGGDYEKCDIHVIRADGSEDIARKWSWVPYKMTPYTVAASQNGTILIAGERGYYEVRTNNGTLLRSGSSGNSGIFTSIARTDGTFVIGCDGSSWQIINTDGTLGAKGTLDSLSSISASVLRTDGSVILFSGNTYAVLGTNNTIIRTGNWIQSYVDASITDAVSRSDGSIVLCASNGYWYILNADLTYGSSGTMGYRFNPPINAAVAFTDDRVLLVGSEAYMRILNKDNTLGDVLRNDANNDQASSIKTAIHRSDGSVFLAFRRGYWQIYTYNEIPSVNISSPLSNSKYSSVTGYNTINISGTLMDKDVGNILNLKYKIDSGAVQSICDNITANGVEQTFLEISIDISALAEDSHNLYIWVEDSIGGKSNITTIPFNIDNTTPTISSSVTTLSTANSITVSGTATDAIAGIDAIPYRYTIGTNEPTEWTTSNPYTQDGLIPNTQYTVKFEARDAVGNIASTTSSIYTKAAAPSLSINSINSYCLNLQTSDNNSTNTQYQISVNDGAQYITPEGTLTTSPVWITLPNKNITVTGLNPSTTYTFTAKAKNAEDIETAWSAPISATTLVQPPNAPVNIIAVATSNSISVVWDPVAGSSGYDIEVDGTIIDNSTYTSYSHTSLTPYTQHTYRVRAKNEGGTGAWSETMSKYTQQDTPNTPFNIDTAATNTSIIVTWQPIPGATGYDIEVDGEVVNNSSSTNYVHTGLLSGTMHGYRVRSINSGGKSEWSNEVLVSTLTDAPIVSSNITATPESGQITVAWDAIPGATYEIEVDGSIKDNGTSNIYLHSNIEAGSSHSYRIRTNKSGSLSDWSAIVTVVIPIEEFGTPKNIKADATDTTVTITWNPVVDATGYEVEVDGVVLDNGTETACVHNGLAPNTQHNYRIRAKGTDKVSDWSEPIAITTYTLPTPTNINTTPLQSSINIAWDVVADATSYELDIDGQLIEVTTNTYTHDGLTPSSQHSYRIRAKNTSGNSNWSTIIKQTTIMTGLNAPQNITALAKSTAITVLWNPIEDVTSYEVEADGVVMPEVTKASYTNTGLQAGSTHTYRVRAKKDGVTTDWSQAITVSTISNGPATPNNLIGSASTTSILLTWDKVDNATEYELEVEGSVINVGAGTKYLHIGLAPDSQHTYRVRAKNISEASAWSLSTTIKTASSINTFSVDNEINEVFNLIFTAANIENPTQYTYSLTYNPDELELLDLCSFTSRIDLGAGNIIGTDIQIVQFEPGTIVFKKLGTANGQVWNGFINSIKFRSKIDSVSVIEYRIN